MNIKKIAVAVLAAAGIALVANVSAAEAVKNKGYASKNHPAPTSLQGSAKYDTLMATVYNWTNTDIVAFIPDTEVAEGIPAGYNAPFTSWLPNPPYRTDFGIYRPNANYPVQYVSVCRGGTISVYGNFSDYQLDIRSSC